jgi:hypothetical protein
MKPHGPVSEHFMRHYYGANGLVKPESRGAHKMTDKEIAKLAEEPGTGMILTKQEALGIYINLIRQFINRDYLYEPTLVALKKISIQYELDNK